MLIGKIPFGTDRRALQLDAKPVDFARGYTLALLATSAPGLSVSQIDMLLS